MDAFGHQRLDHERGCLPVVARERRIGGDDGHVAAETGEGLRHLHADRACADDEEMVGQFSEVPQGLVGEMRRVGNARDGRDQGSGAGGKHDARGGEDGLADLHPALAQQAGTVADDLHPHAFHAFGRIMRGDGGNGAVDVGVDVCPFDLRGRQRDAQCLARMMRPGGGGDQRLGRDAAGVEAFAAHLVRFDQRDLAAEQRDASGSGEPGGARANHDSVI